MPRWTVYGRADCSLCEEMLADLVRVLGPDAAPEIEILDVDADAGVQQKYGQRIPVLLVDGEFLCAYKLDEERIQPFLTSHRRKGA